MNSDLRIRLLLSLQAALLGNVTANIRAVTCGIAGENITLHVVFDGAIIDEDKATAEEVGSELASHFEHERVEVLRSRVDAPIEFKDQVGPSF